MASFWSVLIFVSACNTASDEKTAPLPGLEPENNLPEPSLRRLTTSQYRNAMTSLLGQDLLFPTNLEPDIQTGGLQEIGASITPISATGVVRYEEASYSLLSQVFEDTDRANALFSCSASTDAECAEELITSFGRLAWRRPLVIEEVDLLRELVLSIGEDSGEFIVGLEFGLAAMLQSPHFLYRSEYGDDSGNLTDYELASKLSFLLWNDIPDGILLDAAESGELSTGEGLSQQLERMLSDSRISDGIDRMFTDFFELYRLDDMVKDPLVFNHAHPEFGSSAREEILQGLRYLILQEDADFRETMTSQRTIVDLRLAALYDIPAPQLEGFGEAWLPESGGRRGLLGRAGFLALHSHSSSSSATLRGIFIRRKLLCQAILPAPADVDVSLPEADADSPTLRERIQTHLEDPTCSSCHQLVDPIGLGLENFDGIGRWRDQENGETIDASGDLDGSPFDNAWDLGQLVADHPDFGPCFARHLYEYANGHNLVEGEEEYLDWLSEYFEYHGWSFVEMMRTMVTSDSFRRSGGDQ